MCILNNVIILYFLTKIIFYFIIILWYKNECNIFDISIRFCKLFILISYTESRLFYRYSYSTSTLTNHNSSPFDKFPRPFKKIGAVRSLNQHDVRAISSPYYFVFLVTNKDLSYERSHANNRQIIICSFHTRPTNSRYFFYVYQKKNI